MATLKLDNLQIEHVGPVNLTVNGGDIVCISGGSGAGKSLLLRAVADVLPHEGDAWLDEMQASQTSPPAWRKTVALLPAESQWWFDTVGEHFACKNAELLGRLGFSADTWNWMISRCSTGEKQRLALLRMLCNQPAALLLDEPTGSLDAKNTAVVEAIIREYADEKQVPVIWVSHSEEQIRRICRMHYEIKDGQLVSA